MSMVAGFCNFIDWLVHGAKLADDIHNTITQEQEPPPAAELAVRTTVFAVQTIALISKATPSSSTKKPQVPAQGGQSVLQRLCSSAQTMSTSFTEPDSRVQRNGSENRGQNDTTLNISVPSDGNGTLNIKVPSDGTLNGMINPQGATSGNYTR